MTRDGELDGLATELTAIPSHDDATAAGDRIEDWLRDATSATVVRDDAGNVLAWRGGGSGAAEAGDGVAADGSAELAVVGHHDVVPPADAQLEGDSYRVERRDGRLHGRGTADMKAAVAAAMQAFRDAEPDGRVAFASFVGEEQGGVGARHAIDAGFAPDRAVVLEGSMGYSAPGVVDVAVAHKGRRELAVTVEGRAAHASEPEKGANAVARACDVVGRLRDLVPPDADVAGHRMTGTHCVTAIAGGEARNAVPARCVVTVDERTVPGRRLDLAPVKALDGVAVEVAQDLPPMRCEDDDFVADAVVATEEAQPERGERPERVVKPHASDAGWLDAAGTDCVVIGPAESGEAHTATESVDLDAVVTCRGVYRRLLDGV